MHSLMEYIRRGYVGMTYRILDQGSGHSAESVANVSGVTPTCFLKTREK